MNINELSGDRQFDFINGFSYIREAGTPGELRAAQAIQEELSSFGINSHMEEFSFNTFEIQEARFLVTEPFQKEYRVTGYGRCGCTPLGGVEAPFLYIENGDDISLSQAKEKIVLLNVPVRKDMYQKLIEAGAVGFLSISGTPLDQKEDLIPAAFSLPTLSASPIQGASIHYRDALELVSRGASRAKLILTQHEITRTSRNISARIEGRDKAKEILTLTAHYDSVPAGPGAYDNMAGCAIIMELCRYFKNHQPRRTLEFVWFGAEEKGLLGSREYVRAHEAELSSHLFNMNVDLAGQLVGGNVAGVTGDPSICQIITSIAQEAGLGISTKNQVWGSDSNTFAWKGIPAMTLNRDGFGMHTRHDTADLISSWSLLRSAQLLGCIADQLGNTETIPFPRAIPTDFMEQLNTYFKSKTPL